MRHHVVGLGRWGTWLARRLAGRRRPLQSVANRTEERARGLARELGVEHRPWANLADGLGAADVVWLCVGDDGLPVLHDRLADVALRLVIQASGTAALPVAAYPVATAWPLQSISAQREPDWARLTCVVEVAGGADTGAVRGVVERCIGPGALLAASAEERALLHLAAVMTQNFTNHLWRLVAERVGLNRLPHLVPLAEAHLRDLAGGASPADLQTGPAARGDATTLARHLDLLAGYPEATEVYERMSAQIAGRIEARR